MQGSCAKKLESCSAIYGALDHFELADLPLDRAGAPWCRERILDGVEVAPEVRGEFCKRCSRTDIEQTIDACPANFFPVARAHWMRRHIVAPMGEAFRAIDKQRCAFR